MAAAELDDIGREVKSGMYRRAGFAPVDFDAFHRVELPKKLAEGASAAVHWDVAGARPFTIVLPGERAYSFVSRADRVEVVGRLAEVDAERHDLGVVLVLDPLEHHRGVQSARVEQHHAMDLVGLCQIPGDGRCRTVLGHSCSSGRDGRRAV